MAASGRGTGRPRTPNPCSAMCDLNEVDKMLERAKEVTHQGGGGQSNTPDSPMIGWFWWALIPRQAWLRKRWKAAAGGTSQTPSAGGRGEEPKGGSSARGELQISGLDRRIRSRRAMDAAAYAARQEADGPAA
jgi:hypothetical protein